jgi:hypothetical protein
MMITKHSHSKKFKYLFDYVDKFYYLLVLF